MSYECESYVLFDGGDLKDVFEFNTLNNNHFSGDYDNVLQRSIFGNSIAGTACIGIALSKIENENKRLALQVYVAEKESDFLPANDMLSAGIVSFVYFRFATQMSKIIINDDYGLAVELSNSKLAWGDVFRVFMDTKPQLDILDNRSTKSVQVVAGTCYKAA